MFFSLFVVVSTSLISFAHCISMSLWTCLSVFEGTCSGFIWTFLTSLCLSWQELPVWMRKDEAHIMSTAKVTMSCFPLLIFYSLKRQRHQYSHVLCVLLARAACYLVRVQVSVGLSLHHMGSLIHGRVEFQISSIVTVCWWVEQDWKWLPWQPVRSSTNLKNLFWIYAWLLSLTNSPWRKNLFVSAVLWYLLMKLCCCQLDRTLICLVYCYLLETPWFTFWPLQLFMDTKRNWQTFNSIRSLNQV